MEASLTSRIRTRSPSRTRITGPGTVPPNVQLLYVTPFAISTVASRIGIRNSFTGAAEAGLSRASYTGCVARGGGREVRHLDLRLTRAADGGERCQSDCDRAANENPAVHDAAPGWGVGYL